MKTKFALLILLSVVAIQAFSADNNENSEKPRFKRIYIGFSVTPDVSYRYLHGNFEPSGVSQADVQGAVSYGNSHSIPEFGINASFKLGINLTHWLAIESGVGYSLIRYRYNSNRYSSPTGFTGNIINQADTFNTTDIETYQYMTVPLGLRLSIGHRKVRAIIAAGADFDFLIRQTAVYTHAYANGVTINGTDVATSNFNTFNLSPYLGVGIDCYFSPTFVLRIMPQAEIQGLKNINTPVTEYLWNAGLNVSFLFGL